MLSLRDLPRQNREITSTEKALSNLKTSKLPRSVANAVIKAVAEKYRHLFNTLGPSMYGANNSVDSRKAPILGNPATIGVPKIELLNKR